MSSNDVDEDKIASKKKHQGSQKLILEKIREKLGEKYISNIYRDKIRTQRTRSFLLKVPPKENRPEIQHTLLGVELKIGKQRIYCPDLATARYLQVFARIGCKAVAVPYDISRISALADDLECSWQVMLLLTDQLGSESGVSGLRKMLVKEIRDEILLIGEGDSMPQFNQNTKQESYRKQ